MNQGLDEVLATIVHEHNHLVQPGSGEVGAFAAETKMALACGWNTKHIREFTKPVFVRRRCRFGWCRRGHWANVIDEEAIAQYIENSELYHRTQVGVGSELKGCFPVRSWKC
jgi:hypothetical protein